MPAGTADFTSLRFSTRELPEQMRIPMWREELGRRIVHVDIELSSDVPFQAEARLQALQGLRALAWKGSAMRFKRLQTNIVDGDDSIGLIVSSTARDEFPTSRSRSAFRIFRISTDSSGPASAFRHVTCAAPEAVPSDPIPRVPRHAVLD